jgi:hypothetical protein
VQIAADRSAERAILHCARNVGRPCEFQRVGRNAALLGLSESERIKHIVKRVVTGQVRQRGSSSFEFVDQVLCVSHEALDDTPSLFLGSPDKRSDHHEIVCALNGAEAA